MPRTRHGNVSGQSNSQQKLKKERKEKSEQRKKEKEENETKKDEMYTIDTLPEERKKRYESLLEDFDKQVEDHIAEANTKMYSIATSIRNAYRVAVFQLQKEQRHLNQEEVVLKNIEDRSNGKVPPRESDIFPKELAKVAENIETTVNKEVTAFKKSTKTGETKSANGKGERKKAPLTSTAYSKRVCENKVLRSDAFANISAVLPATTTPLSKSAITNRQIMRYAKPNELGMSLHGSPMLVPPYDHISPSKEATLSAAVCHSETNVASQDNQESVQEITVDADLDVQAKFQSLWQQIDSMRKMQD